EKPVTFEDVRNMNQKTRWHLMIFSRIHSIGSEMKFDYHWEDQPEPTKYTEDLTEYIHDYTKPFPKPGEEGYSKYKMEPYPENAYGDFEFITRSGKVMKMNIMNRRGELWLLSLD